MTTTVHGANNPGAFGGRSCQVLSDGSVVAIVEEGTGFGAINVYHSSDRVTWTNKAAFVPTSLLVSGGLLSIIGFSADASDNLYVMYSGFVSSSSHPLYYRKLTKGGGYTWTLGAEEIAANSGTDEWQFMDVDMLAPDMPIVVATHFSAAAATYKIFLRNSTGTWTTVETAGLGGTITKYERGGTCTIARDAAGVSGSVGKYAVIIDNGPSGSLLYVGTLNVTTSALTKSIVQTIFSAAATRRHYNLFSTASGEWTALGHIDPFVTAARFNATGAYSVEWTPGYLLDGYNAASGVGFSWAGNAGVFTWVGDAYWKATTVVFRSGILVATSTAFWGDTLSVSTPLNAGNNRNLNLLKHDHIRRLAGSVVHQHNRPPPTSITDLPPNGGTVATSDPTFGAHILQTTFPQARLHPVFTTVDTTTSVTTVIGADTASNFSLGPAGANGGSPATPVTFSATVGSSGGVHHQHAFTMTSKFVDELGVAGPSSGSTSFTVSHPPSATGQTPATPVAYTTGDTVFTWAFGDPWSGDSQTAYQYLIERNDTGVGLFDSGKVTSTTHSVTKNLDVSYKDLPLRWKIRVWDRDDVAGAYSGYKTFSVLTPPTITITTPTTFEVLTTPSPTIAWTYSSPGGHAQFKFTVRLYDRTVDPHVEVYTSGVVNGAATSFTVPAGIVERGLNYDVTVTAVDNQGVEGTGTQPFTAFWDGAPQPDFVVDVSTYQPSGYVRITWDSANIDPFFTGWNVWRRHPIGFGLNRWTLIGRRINVSPTYELKDYGVVSGMTQEYVVVQEAIRFGVPVESTYTTTYTVTPISTDYWLVSGVDSSLNLKLPLVTADTFTEEIEEADVKLIGRGVRREFGTIWGFKGTLTIQVYGSTAGSSRAFRLNLQRLKDDQTKMFLRNPFGDLWLVAMSDIAIARIAGVGREEYHTVTIPYQEVR